MRLTIFLTENVKNRPATSQYSEAIESRGGEMTLFHKSFFAQRSTRISAAATVCLYMFLAACPTPGAAQGASTRNALRLLGKFAVTVAANVATSIASDEAKAAIHPEQNANGNATSIASDEAKAAIHPEQNANGNATSVASDEAKAAIHPEQNANGNATSQITNEAQHRFLGIHSRLRGSRMTAST